MTITDDTQVEVRVSGRFDVLTLPWRQAYDRFVKLADIPEPVAIIKLRDRGGIRADVDGVELFVQLRAVPRETEQLLDIPKFLRRGED